MILFAVRLIAPSTLLDQDQERPAAYVLDVLKNGHWACQHDLTGDIASKPPLWTWLSALASMPAGRITRFSLWLPGAVAAWGTALLLFRAGTKPFGAEVAFWAAISVMVCSAGLKEFGLARTDGVFAFTVTATALAAFCAWSEQDAQVRRWTLFWICAGLATLTKGPLGLLLGASGLLAGWWEKKSGERLRLRGAQVPGVALFLGLILGWFALACAAGGTALVNKMIGRELVGHALSSDTGRHFPGSLFYQPVLYYLGRAAPWSLLALWGFWRVWKRPALDLLERRFERFLFCWFACGLLILSLSPHQRGDLLWPIIPAGALLAGRQLVSLCGRFGRGVMFVATLTVILMITGFAFYYFRVVPAQPVNQLTPELEQLAAKLLSGAGETPLTCVDAPMALPILLNQWRQNVSAEIAAGLLRGPTPAFIAVRDLHQLERYRNAQDPPLTLVATVRRPSGSNFVSVVSNQPKLESGPNFAFATGPFTIEGENIRITKVGDKSCSFEAAAHPAHVIIRNHGTQLARMKVVFNNPPLKPAQQILGPGEAWRTTIP